MWDEVVAGLQGGSKVAAVVASKVWGSKALARGNKLWGSSRVWGSRAMGIWALSSAGK
jgi:hypothetical protein